MKKISKGEGFTIIELLVVASIFIILSTIFLASYDTMRWQANLRAQTQKLISIFKQAQTMTLTNQTFMFTMTDQPSKRLRPRGYGIQFREGSGSNADDYFLFADHPAGGVPYAFDNQDVVVQTFILPLPMRFYFGVDAPPNLLFSIQQAMVYRNGILLSTPHTFKIEHLPSNNFLEIRINVYGRIEIVSQ